MEHIRQFDWCYNEPDSPFFLTDNAMDNSSIERVLSNSFYDPLISSDEEEQRPPIDWSQVVKKPIISEAPSNPRSYVPGLRSIPEYPHISSLSRHQHAQMLKVLNSMYPNVLEAVHIPRPTKLDYKLFEDLKQKYQKEQAEYKAWAKSLWASGHNIRALRPKPTVEAVYEAEFKMKMAEHDSLPKSYEMAAQIALRSEGSCELVHLKDLIKVNQSELPCHVPLASLFEKKLSVIRPSASPEPCKMHPCRIVLPGESTVTTLPLPEAQVALAQLAAESGARAALSGAAAEAMAAGGPWTLPVRVCPALGADGEMVNVVVIGDPFPITRESSQTRTYKAFKHLLLYTLIPYDEKARIMNSWKSNSVKPTAAPKEVKPQEEVRVESDDEDETGLVIDVDILSADEPKIEETYEEEQTVIETPTEHRLEGDANTTSDAKEGDGDTIMNETLDSLTCTCEGSAYERPPPRSFRKWELRSKNGSERFPIIIHCSHKLRSKSGEIIPVPIPEYQIDLGASEITDAQMKSIAIDMHLRRNASALLMRIDGATGDLVSHETITQAESQRRAPSAAGDFAAELSAALAQLKDLMPGQYLLKHEPSHGANAILYVSRAHPRGESLHLKFDLTAAVDDAKSLSAPVIADVLLPSHKHRGILPCAFSPFKEHLPRERRPRAPPRARAPPQAIKLDAVSEDSSSRRKWPKKKRGKKRPAT